MAMFSARGLNNFISELRACSSREEEQRRVDKELVKIRQKFTQTQSLQSYDKKKYAWKLIYIFMLGYDIDFGHMQVINLVSGSKYSEKCLGYLGCSILLKSSDELMTLVVNSIRNDLKSPDASHQCLALCCVANMGGSEFAEVLSPDAVSLFMSSSSIAHVRKKAALCIRRLLPPNPELIPVDELENRIRTLMSESHLGVVTSTASLLQTALSLHPTKFRSVVDVILSRLNSLVQQKACPRDYMYYNTPCPWLQVKLLRLLQQYGPLEDPGQRTQLHDTLHRILARPAPGKGAKNNAAYSVLIEAVNLVISQGRRAFSAPGDDSAEGKGSKLVDLAVQLLARFIAVSEPNIRYIGLDSMHRFVRREGEAASAAIRAHQATVLFSLKDADNSVRRRALDLLFSMCDAESARTIVGELVTYLAVAEGSIREELVLKAAILAEKYATDLRWYVDTVLQLITIAGSEVPDDVWHRVVQIVTNREELQPYAAEAMFRALEPKHVDETTAKFGAYVLGEFGYLLADRAGMSSVEQFEVLHRHYSSGMANVATKSLILTALVKMTNLFDELRPRVLEVFKKGATHMDLELQQRACEYLALHHVQPGDENELMKRVLEPMPVFPENRESALIVRLRNQQKAAEGGSENVAAVADDEDDSAPEPTSGGGGEIDLLSLDSPQKTAKPSGFGGAGGADAIRGANPVADLVDVFGGGGGVSGDKIGLDASMGPKLREWSRGLMIAPQGVLLENDVLQIGAKHEYRGSQGRIQLFFGNKTNDALADFKVEADGGTTFRMQSEDVPSGVAPKQQVKQQIMLEAMAPFTSPPAMTVSFTRAGSRYSYVLQLPSQATNFMEPVPLGGEDFMKRWGALEGQDREQSEVVTAAGKMDMEQTRKWLTESLKLAVVEVC